MANNPESRARRKAARTAQQAAEKKNSHLKKISPAARREAEKLMQEGLKRISNNMKGSRRG